MSNEKCLECSMKDKKTKKRTEEEKRNIIKRLNVIEGQVRGIKQMIVDNRYCDDVLIQIAAVNKSLQTLGNSILENHIKTCVVSDIQKGDLGILEEVMQMIKKLQ